MEPKDGMDVVLPHDHTAPGLARTRSRQTLNGWHLRTLVEPVLLIVSELVTNAVRHGTPPVRFGLSRTNDRVRIEVADASPLTASAALPDADSESGRGLFLVDALADASGVEPVPGDGKVSWAVVSEDSSWANED